MSPGGGDRGFGNTYTQKNNIVNLLVAIIILFQLKQSNHNENSRREMPTVMWQSAVNNSHKYKMAKEYCNNNNKIHYSSICNV